MKTKDTVALLLMTLLTGFYSRIIAQEGPAPTLVVQRPYSGKQVALLFGLSQTLLAKGFNAELNYFTRKLAFDYSHGASLDLPSNAVSTEINDQQLVVHLPFSTGFGIGYRLNKLVNLRVEPKMHRFELYYDGDSQTASNRITAYNTFTLGLGLYMKWHPFGQQQNFLKGLLVAPSIRYWPNVATGLQDNQTTYFNRQTGQSETHEALRIGINNTPLVVNVSIGYALDLGRK